MLKTALILGFTAFLIFQNDLLSFAYFINDKKETNELLAVKKERTNLKRIEKVLLKRNAQITNTVLLSDSGFSYDIIKLSDEANQDLVKNELLKTGLFKIVEPNYILESDYNIVSVPSKKIIPDDESFKKQYYLNETKVTNAWLLSIGSGNIPIAVLDSGADYLNSDISERLLPCTSYVDNSFSCQDNFGHGTQVISIIAAKPDNGLGTAGITWLNPILPVKISNEEGIATVSTLISGLDHAVKSSAKIAVISLSTEKESEILKQAVEDAIQNGLLIISSGGNTGKEEIRYPAGYDGVIGVGSVNSKEQISDFSNTGSHIKIVSPGEKILVPVLNQNKLELVNGTSFSAPQVAGIAALIWALRPTYTNKDIEKLLLTTADDLGEPGYDTVYGYGLVNADTAIKRAILKYEK